MSLNARIAGTDLRATRKIGRALASIFGIGESTSKAVCATMGLNPAGKFKDVPFAVPIISGYVESLGQNQSNIIRKESAAVMELIRLQTYRGQRHQYCLPLNGQKNTNARTQRKLGMFRAKTLAFPLAKPKQVGSKYSGKK